MSAADETRKQKPAKPCAETRAETHGAAHEALPEGVGGGGGGAVHVAPRAKAKPSRRARPVANAVDLAAACARGDKAAAARLLTLLESREVPEAAAASAAAARLPLPAWTIGLTGPPGAGKSTLTDYLLDLLRRAGRKPAVLAVDPSSPFTGGALLGDRIRMSNADGGTFIRSMAARGSADGLAVACGDALRVLGGVGHDIVLLETVGAGQDETDLIALADTVVLLHVPGAGDDVQLLKCGIKEIADVFVVHKSDLPGAAEAAEMLRADLALAPTVACRVLRQLGPKFSFSGRPWTSAVVEVSSLHRRGGAELFSALEAHREFVDQPELTEALRRDRLRREMLRRAAFRFKRRLAEELKPGGKFDALVNDCLAQRLDLGGAVERLLK